MSKLNVDEIRNSLDSETTPPNIPGLKPQLASAWVNFNGTGVVSIRDSFNVSSVTDNGIGNYRANFIDDMPNENYSAVTSGDVESSNIPLMSVEEYTTGYARIQSTGWDGGGASPSFPADRPFISLLVFCGN
ncbi:hypothetical protein NVP1052A_26 [Vibrio phage 1.052.A._10N.286.46.C3]|nr:hypothetical protein NVP1052A_26 [Vibrio phage 1.052.A._10N.286.46.C3]